MKTNPKVAIITMEGTNNELESYLSFKYSKGSPEIVHLKQLETGKKTVGSYDIIHFPGGFSAGDYIRAGAIMAARIRPRLMKEIELFIEDGKPVIGSCNGFQVLVELGILPNTGNEYKAEAALAPNISDRFEARTVYVKVKKGNSLFLSGFKDEEIIELPVAHSEGRFITKNDSVLKDIMSNGTRILTYVDFNGEESGYPWNPNGSVLNIAGICNKEGNVIGLMPHPERVFDRYTESDWTRKGEVPSTGSKFFESAVKYVKEKF